MGSVHNKRKLDNSAANQLITVSSPSRMRKDQTFIQFFVRSFPIGRTVLIRARPTDSVESIHHAISSVTGIPATVQRLIHNGNQLRCEQTLSECGIGNDASLQLTGRVKSTRHPLTWHLISDLVSLIFDICKSDYPPLILSGSKLRSYFTPLVLSYSDHITKVLKNYLNMALRLNCDDALEHFDIFVSCLAPVALVRLYMSTKYKYTASECVRQFITSMKSTLPEHMYSRCGRIVLELCKLLKSVAGVDDDLYGFCRSSLGVMVASAGLATDEANSKGLLVLHDVFPFVCELAFKLLGGSMGLSLSDMRDFIAFVVPVRNAIHWQAPYRFPVVLPLRKDDASEASYYYGEFIDCLHRIFCELLDKMEQLLRELEVWLGFKGSETEKVKHIVLWWSEYLVILKELHSISKLYKGMENVFWQKMEQRKASLCYLLVKFGDRPEDYQWILQHKEITNFEVRRQMAMRMLPQISDDKLHEMLIDRSRLLEESFQYIGCVDPENLRGSLFMEFKHEEATGPGVLREWFFLVSRAIFNPQNALFVACPNDRRRFFPNSASKVHQLHLEYFCFAGRMIALALMHEIQIGVVFDRVFFLQLAGKSISLEDIRDADPHLYNSCKQILAMDPETVDQDALGLTFVSEVEELGSRKAVELCHNGKNVVVNSKNREKYVNLLIGHRFVTLVNAQVAHFRQGFADIITTPSLQTSFFRGLELEDLDQMLDGSNNTIFVEDWKTHTDYLGYEESDPQVSWFWKIVALMSAEQRRSLLFFWTSVKYLPLEGFGGLASRLCIYKTSESHDHLPSSQTCFCTIKFPPYQSMAIMKDRLRIITQEHVACSFGTG